MAFAPNLCSTPKFVPVSNQPSHFVVIAPPIVRKTEKQKQVIKSTNHVQNHPLRKRHCHYHLKQSNASTAINRQHHFHNDTTIHNHQQKIFFCLPFNLFHLSKRKRHVPCHV